jgi:tRNA(Ile)-lysidine synthetase-like protein
MHQGIVLKFENNGIYCLESTAGSAESGPEAKKSGSRELQKVILDGTVSTVSWQGEKGTHRLTMRKYSRPTDLVYPAASEGRAIFDAGLFSCTLVVRTRRNGDCFSPYGVRSRTRKLKAFLNEKKVPIRMRNSLPIVLSDETLAWVPGFGISEFYKVTDTTTSILELVLTCENL